MTPARVVTPLKANAS